MNRHSYREQLAQGGVLSRVTAWRKNIDLLVLFVAAALLLYGLFALQDNFPMGDEQFHYDQIERFLRLEWTLNPSLTTIPGFHLLIVIPAWTGLFSSLQAFRIASFFISILSVGMFFVLARRVHSPSAILRTVQYMVFPLLFPLFHLVYTDVMSLLFLFLSLFLFIKRKFYLSGAVAFANVLIRQSNVVWIVFFMAVIAWETFRHIRTHLHEPLMPYVAAILRQSAAYIAGILFFLLFVWWNRGVVLGDAFAHPFPAVHFGNVHFALFLFFFLFLPLMPFSLSEVHRRIAKYWLPIVAGLGIYFLFYWLTFRIDHPYNQPELEWFLHNRLLHFFTETDGRKALFFVPVALSVLFLTVARVRKPFTAMFYPFALLSLLPYWLIEQRYALPVFILFLLLREPSPKRAEYLLASYWIIISLLLLPGINRGTFFL